MSSEDSSNKVVKTSIGTLRVEGRFLILDIDKDRRVEIGKEEADQVIADSTAITGGEPSLVIWDGRGSEIIVDPEGRVTFAESDEAAKYRKAVAFVVDSLANRLSANFFVKFNKPPAPAAVFDDMDEARTWLLEQDG